MSLEEMCGEGNCLLNGPFQVLPGERLGRADTLWPLTAHSITAHRFLGLINELLRWLIFSESREFSLKHKACQTQTPVEIAGRLE